MIHEEDHEKGNVHLQEDDDLRPGDAGSSIIYNDELSTLDVESVGRRLPFSVQDDLANMGNSSHHSKAMKGENASIIISEGEGATQRAPEDIMIPQQRRHPQLSARWLITAALGLCVVALVAVGVTIATKPDGKRQNTSSMSNDSAAVIASKDFPSNVNITLEPTTSPSRDDAKGSVDKTSTPTPSTSEEDLSPINKDLTGPPNSPSTIAPTREPQIAITNSPSSSKPDDEFLDDDDVFVGSPYQGIVTTPLDLYEPEDCYYGDNVQPHVLSQCECFQQISIIANDTQQLYFDIRADINEELYGGMYNEPMGSCDPVNQALVWLSSGNTRDNGDLYQRFVAAMTFIQLNGTVWDQKQLWLSDESECMWYGILCNGKFQVIDLNLDTNNVHGSIPTEISYIGTLKSLSLNRNHLSGTIPTEIISMPNLDYLALFTNQLGGSIPEDIAKATKLKTIRLENNLMFGSIATEIGQATALEELSIGFNQFWRRLPTELGLLTNMKVLILEENIISGTIPSEMGRMSLLEDLDLSKNHLTGPIPIELQNMAKLRTFLLTGSGISGIFPTQLASLTSLQRLDASNNNLKGTIMTEIGKMTSLEILSMNDNDLTGTIPTEVGRLQNMTRMNLSNCFLSGTIPTQLGSMWNLENLSVQGNLLTGTAPSEVCTLRNIELTVFVTDCKTEEGGVDCPDDCCTYCKRSASHKLPTRTPTSSPTSSPPNPFSASRSPSSSKPLSMSPFPSPIALPSTSPSALPTVSPSMPASTLQTVSPSTTPSISESALPTMSPSAKPSISPSLLPSQSPSGSPSGPAKPAPQPSLVKPPPITAQPAQPKTSSPTPVQPTSSPVSKPTALSHGFDPLYINSGSQEKIVWTENGKKKWVSDIPSSQEIDFPDESLIDRPSQEIDFPGCFKDLHKADLNNDGFVKLNEYLGFIQEYGKRICSETDRLSLQHTATFNTLACICRTQGDFDGDCCLGKNARIPTDGALVPIEEQTPNQRNYLTSVCKLTDATIDGRCSPIPRYSQFGESKTNNKFCERDEEHRLLCSERWYPVAGGYIIPAPKGGKYQIIMYFEEVIPEDIKFQRRFNIYVQGILVRKEYDILEEAEGPNKLTTVKWVIEDLQQDEIHIRFESIEGKDHAKISAVEIQEI